MNEIENQMRTEKLIRDVGRVLDDVLTEQIGRRMGFALMVFEFGKPGPSNYISNGTREDMIMALREAADRLEQNKTIPPVHAPPQ